MKTNELKTRDCVILQHVFISSFFINMTVMTQRTYNIYYAWNGIVHQNKQSFSTYVLCMAIQ